MKYYFSTLFLLLVVLSNFSCSAQKDKPPVVLWMQPMVHDFGDIPRHQPVTAVFEYKNLTNAPITIDNIRVNCGCTAPDWTDAPIAPDSIGQIKLVYDAEKKGGFYKKVMVFFNSQRRSELIFVEGYVEE